MELTLAIPNFNGGRFLSATLESLNRNRPRVRWYLQDAGSSDHSLAIAQKLAGPEDRIVQAQDLGQADGLNAAFDQMGGEIVGFLNADDCLSEGAAQAVLHEFEQDPALDLIYGEVDWIDESGALRGHHSGCISNLQEMLAIYDVWWRGRQWVQPEVFFRRSLWERVGQFNTEYDLAFDYDYWVRCFQAGAKVKRIPRTLAQFRRHSAQKSVRADQAANEIRDIVSKALASGGADDKQLQTMLDYDRYQSGQDYPPGTQRPSLARMLLREPAWTFLPPVRARVAKSVLGAFRSK
jgi:glycosyltransferase involved in cell wall biosynthesis